MALIICAECGKEISDRAESCPNCGCPVGESVSEEVNGKCPYCGEQLNENELYCDSCGMRVGPYERNEKKLESIYADESLKESNCYKGFVFSIISLIAMLFPISRPFAVLLIIIAFIKCITYIQKTKEKIAFSIIGIIISILVLLLYAGYYIYIFKVKYGML